MKLFKRKKLFIAKYSYCRENKDVDCGFIARSTSLPIWAYDDKHAYKKLSDHHEKNNEKITEVQEMKIAI